MGLPFACHPSEDKTLSLSEIRFFTERLAPLTGARYANREKAGRKSAKMTYD
jgi:hypothetical protein